MPGVETSLLVVPGAAFLTARHSLVAGGVTPDVSLAIVGVLARQVGIILANRMPADRDDTEIADLQGVSLAGSDGPGAFITTVIAFHDLPEGPAIARVLILKGPPF